MCVLRIFETGVAEGAHTAIQLIPAPDVGAFAGRGLRHWNVYDRFPAVEQHRREKVGFPFGRHLTSL